MRIKKNNPENIIIFSVRKRIDGEIITRFFGVETPYNKNFFPSKGKKTKKDWFNTHLNCLYGLHYMDEFGNYRGELVNLNYSEPVTPELLGVNKWQIDNLIIVDEIGEFRGTLSELRAERGTLDVSYYGEEEREIYWKPFCEVSQEELIYFFANSGDAICHNEILKYYGAGLFDPHLVDLIFPIKRAFTINYIACSPERAAELLINFDCIQDAIDCGEVVLSPTDEGYYFNDAYYIINPHSYQEHSYQERAAIKINTYLTHLS